MEGGVRAIREFGSLSLPPIAMILSYLLSRTTPSTVFGMFCMKFPSLLAEHTELTVSGRRSHM